jgi:uncharacterized protein (TIGR03435 family)
MSRFQQTGLVLTLLTVGASAAVASEPTPVYRSARIHAATPASPTTYTFFPGGRFKATNVTIGYLAGIALQSDRIDTSWLPAATANKHFDVEATPDLPFDTAARISALRSLLEDRFQFRYHRVASNVARWSLIAERNPRLTLAPPRASSESFGFAREPEVINGRDVSLFDLSEYLSSILNQPVIDRTKLTFRYDIHLIWQPPVQTQATEASLAAALHSQLGLNLEPSAASIETIVLDMAVDPTLDSILGESPAFEAATIKPSDPSLGQHGYPVRGGPGTDDPSRISYTNTNFKALLYHAYGFPSNLVQGPSWISSENFDVVATIPQGATKDDLKMMVQGLLKERFHLVCHRETQTVNGFGLTVGPKGFKATSNNRPSEGYPQLAQPGMIYPFAIGSKNKAIHLIAKQQTLATLTPFLSGQVGTPCVDETNLTDRYDFTLEFAVDSVPDSADLPYPTLSQALKEQLGLTLRPRKVDQERLIVDSVLRTPTPN